LAGARGGVWTVVVGLVVPEVGVGIGIVKVVELDDALSNLSIAMT
jgi:hypothetical protein